MTDLTTALNVKLEEFAYALRQNGIVSGPQKRIDFLRAVQATRPGTTGALYWAARITLISDADQIPIFDRVFAQWFGETVETSIPPEAPPEAQNESTSGGRPPAVDPEIIGVREGSGQEASHHEILSTAGFRRTSEAQARSLAEIGAAAREHLPRTRSRRRVASRRGKFLDMRRTAAAARRTGGDIVKIRHRRRPSRPRRILMLIDVSGSLRATFTDALRCAHALTREAERMEAYSFGTRLTRITGTLQENDCDRALARLAATVDDVNGGTRIGAALDAFLADPRRVSSARDAVVIVVSDGLERGDPKQMTAAVARLARLSHRIVWWSPLACDPEYQPLTRAMAAIVDELDDLVGVDDLPSAVLAVRRLSRSEEAR